LPVSEVKSASQTTAKARFSKFCYFDTKINDFIPYLLQSLSLPSVLSNGFCCQLRMQTGWEYSEAIFAVKTDIPHQFTYLNLQGFHPASKQIQR
jgi:hypothetical protein